jgi:NAD(P)H-flavin reductase/hemoglobin-like flavoprotein
VADIDTTALKTNFAAVATHGDEVAMFFYSYLFFRHPETRDMFAPAMTRQRDRLIGALGHIVSNVDEVDELVPFLRDLGRDHRKFGALAAHYPAVGDALVTTLRHFSGEQWTEQLETDWAAAYGIVAATMSGAADKAAETEPPYWDAEVLDVDRRTFDIAVLRVRTSEPVPYLAGQSVAVQSLSRRPQEWRFYTPASAPGDVEFELHARLIDGGPVSTALVRATAPGDTLRLGPPVGQMTLDPFSDLPLLMVAGGTGLAPMKAMIEHLAQTGERPTQLFFGVRTARELYDRTALADLDARHPWLSVTTAVSDDTRWSGPRGTVGDVAVSAGEWSGHDAYVCGSPAMVEATVKKLLAHGVPARRIRYDEFGEN